METPVIILPTLTNRTSFAANPGTLTMAAFQWNSNERGVGKLPHSPQLFGVLRICCHASGVPVPGSGVGHSALLLLQGPHQTTGVGVGVYACVGEVHGAVRVCILLMCRLYIQLQCCCSAEVCSTCKSRLQSSHHPFACHVFMHIMLY